MKSFWLSFLIVLSFSSVAISSAFTNMCPSNGVNYCDNVGKTAMNGPGSPPALKGIELGDIVGVAWKMKGALIGSDGRTSPRNAYYYIINSYGSEFLRQCREIDAK
jgi:hypothetical protein